VRSIDKFGFIVPVILDGGGALLSGDARVEAARELGMVEIPAICVTHLSNEENRAFTLAYNRLAELASWDEAILKQELRFLAKFDIDFDFSAIGFDTAEVDILLDDQDAEQDEIEAALISAVGQPSVSKLGDLWKLDQHTGLLRRRASNNLLRGGHGGRQGAHGLCGYLRSQLRTLANADANRRECRANCRHHNSLCNINDLLADRTRFKLAVRF